VVGIDDKDIEKLPYMKKVAELCSATFVFFLPVGILAENKKT
jgi:hypothetical protein